MSRLALLFVVVCLCAPALLPAAPVEAGTALKLDLGGLVERAELVCEARVQSLECVRDERGRIETRCTLAVTRTFLGDPAALRVVRLPGGVLPDGRGLVLPGMPRLVQGEEALLFLSPESRTGLRLPVGLSQGRLRIERKPDGARQLVREAEGLDLVDEHGQRLPAAAARELLDYATVVAQVETLAQRKRARGEKR